MTWRVVDEEGQVWLWVVIFHALLQPHFLDSFVEFFAQFSFSWSVLHRIRSVVGRTRRHSLNFLFPNSVHHTMVWGEVEEGSLQKKRVAGEGSERKIKERVKTKLRSLPKIGPFLITFERNCRLFDLINTGGGVGLLSSLAWKFTVSIIFYEFCCSTTPLYSLLSSTLSTGSVFGCLTLSKTNTGKCWKGYCITRSSILLLNCLIFITCLQKKTKNSEQREVGKEMGRSLRCNLVWFFRVHPK